MLKRLEPTVNRVLSRLGLEVTRLAEPRVRYENFSALCAAYEWRLAEAGISLPADERRARLLARLLGTPPGEAYFIIAALSRIATVGGDVCEFGVAQGETSALIANEIRTSNKTLHLFDSFQGLPAPSKKDKLQNDVFSLGSMEAYEGTMSCPEDMVHARLAAIDFPSSKCVIHRGFVEEVLARGDQLPRTVSFAYVDFDFYEPTRATLYYLDGVLTPGAEIIVDDYGFFSTGVKTAVDEFVTERCADGTTYRCEVPDVAYGHFAVLTRTEA